MKPRGLAILLAITISVMALLLIALWNGLTFNSRFYEVTVNKTYITRPLNEGDRVLLSCHGGVSCEGMVNLMNSNYSTKIVKDQTIIVPKTGNYSLYCVVGNCLFKVESASPSTLTIRYSISGLGLIVLTLAVMLFKASIYSRPSRNFIHIGKHVECQAKTLRKHTCIIKPAEGINDLFDIVLNYFINELSFKLMSRKGSFALLKGRLGGFWKGSISLAVYQLEDGSVGSEFVFPGIGAEGTLDLEKLAKKLEGLERKIGELNARQFSPP